MLGVASIGLPVVVLMAVGGLRYTGVSASIQTALLVPTFVVMAFNEEIICRGYLVQNLLDISRPVLAVVFSAAVFWLMHWLNPSAWSSPLVGVNLFGAGVVLALAYRLSGNIWFPTALHFAWNFTQGVLFQLPVSGIRTDGVVDLEPNEAMPVWLTGGDFGLEASVLVTAVEAAQVLLFVWILSRRRDAESSVVLLQASPTHESVAS